jgi:hypothetical protein
VDGRVVGRVSRSYRRGSRGCGGEGRPRRRRRRARQLGLNERLKKTDVRLDRKGRHPAEQEQEKGISEGGNRGGNRKRKQRGEKLSCALFLPAISSWGSGGEGCGGGKTVTFGRDWWMEADRRTEAVGQSGARIQLPVIHRPAKQPRSEAGAARWSVRWLGLNSRSDWRGFTPQRLGT